MSTFLKWEAEAFGDIHIVDMEENMDDGKSYEYFASLGNMYPAGVGQRERLWDYAMKLDDDSFLNIPNLLEKLRPIVPRRTTWFVHNPAPLLLNVDKFIIGFRRCRRVVHVWTGLCLILGSGDLAL